jgi:hypothetical protein
VGGYAPPARERLLAALGWALLGGLSTSPLEVRMRGCAAIRPRAGRCHVGLPLCSEALSADTLSEGS